MEFDYQIFIKVDPRDRGDGPFLKAQPIRGGQSIFKRDLVKFIPYNLTFQRYEDLVYNGTKVIGQTSQSGDYVTPNAFFEVSEEEYGWSVFLPLSITSKTVPKSAIARFNMDSSQPGLYIFDTFMASNPSFSVPLSSARVAGELFKVRGRYSTERHQSLTSRIRTLPYKTQEKTPNSLINQWENEGLALNLIGRIE